MKKFLLLIFLANSLSAAINHEVDGALTESSWNTAHAVSDFVETDPNIGGVPDYKTSLKYFTNEQGIYIGIINTQPEGMGIATYSSRDSGISSDYNRIILDFDGNGQAGYEFTVSSADSIQDAIWTNENNRSSEWDGRWYHAVIKKSTEWTAELFIPWTVAPMNSSSRPERVMGLLVERRIAKLRHTYSSANADSDQSTYLSKFPKVRVKQYESSSLDGFLNIVGGYDANKGDSTLDFGGDVFWKPTSNQQVSLTIKPDFSQVDSDDLVINFSPDEVFFNEKRAFFTENQSVFTSQSPLSIGRSPNLKLIHTRRVGAAPDSGDESTSDINTAAKYTLLSDKVDFGFFAADEDDTSASQGRDFYASRILGRFGANNLALTGTFTDRPEINRQAIVTSADGKFALGDSVILRGMLLQSSIEDMNEENSIGTSTGKGGFLNAVYSPSSDTRYRFQAINLDNKLDINDLGFQSRGDLRSLSGEWTHTKNYEESSIQRDYMRIQSSYSENGLGEKLPSLGKLSWERKFSDTSRFYTSFEHRTTGYDDRFTRGSGSIRLEDFHSIYAEYHWDQSGDFRHNAAIWLASGGTLGQETWLHYNPTYYFSELTNVTIGLYYTKNQGWLNWSGLNDSSEPVISSFDREKVVSRFKLNHAILPSQELSLNIQWVGVKAGFLESFEVERDALKPTSEKGDDDFYVSDFGLQARYKYQISPLSNFFLVYSRGGYDDCQGCEASLVDVFDDGIKQKTVNRFFAKIRLSLI